MVGVDNGESRVVYPLWPECQFAARSCRLKVDKRPHSLLPDFLLDSDCPLAQGMNCLPLNAQSQFQRYLYHRFQEQEAHY